MAVAPRTASRTLQKFTETVDELFALPPAPRQLKGKTKSLMKDVTPGALRLMTASEKVAQEWTVFGVASLIFFSVVTAGILPIVFMSMASQRKSRMKRFFRDGTPTVASVIKIELQETAFDEKLARVGYEFSVDGQVYRDSDTVLPVIADRWQPGDQVSILYLPNKDCDSVIVALE